MAKPQIRAGMAAAGAVLVLVAVAAVAVVLRSGVEEFDADTPEGTVQRYVEALLDGDDQAAAAFLTPGNEPCDFFDPGFLDTVRVGLIDVTTRDTSAGVQVRITTAGGEPPFERYESSSEGEFRLTRGPAGAWLVEQAPWPFEICKEE
jgi:hypothetical protein